MIPCDSRTGRLRRAWPLGLVLLVAACGSDNGTGTSTSPNAPNITNLRVSYTPTIAIPGTLIQVTFLVDVTDPDGDWVGGQCEFTTGDQLVVPVQTTGLPANATSGTALCAFIETFQNDTVRIDLRLADRAGHVSNVISGLATLEGPRPRS